MDSLQLEETAGREPQSTRDHVCCCVLAALSAAVYRLRGRAKEVLEHT